MQSLNSYLVSYSVISSISHFSGWSWLYCDCWQRAQSRIPSKKVQWALTVLLDPEWFCVHLRCTPSEKKRVAVLVQNLYNMSLYVQQHSFDCSVTVRKVLLLIRYQFCTRLLEQVACCLEQNFSANEQCFSFTTNQHKPNFSETNKANWSLW